MVFVINYSNLYPIGSLDYSGHNENGFTMEI